MKTRSARNRNVAFTLMELLVVVVILGVLAATILPKFIGTTEQAKVNAAKADVAQLENGIERFHLNMERYPTAEEGLKVLVDRPGGDEKKWQGPYISVLRNDPWGNPYQYRIPGAKGKRFDVWSRGADNADGGEGDAADLGNW